MTTHTSPGSVVDVDTRVLRYFAVVADRLSFTQAAKDLFITQPSLSRQIQQLEHALGTRVFERTGNQIRLTSAGVELRTRVQDLLLDWQEAARVVRSLAAQEANTLRIGFVATGGGILARRARATFTGKNPSTLIEPKRLDWGGETDALRQGLVDVAFIWLPADTTGLRVQVVATERRWVALSRTHRLAVQETVSINDLRDEPLMWTSRADPEWVNWWAVNPRPDGSEPTWGPHNDNVEEMLEHTAAGEGVCLVAESMTRYYAHPDLAWLPVVDVEPLRIAIGYPKGITNPLVLRYVNTVVELVGDASESNDRAVGS